jgi:hypothetical protein
MFDQGGEKRALVLCKLVNFYSAVATAQVAKLTGACRTLTDGRGTEQHQHRDE